MADKEKMKEEAKKALATYNDNVKKEKEEAKKK